jgi:CheY-like chemotaxis protein
VAIVDIGLPRLTGYEVARRLRQNLGNEVFLIALTGYNRADDRRRSREAGFDIHLCKPADLDPLLQLLRQKAPPHIRPVPRRALASRTILRTGKRRTDLGTV